MAPTQTQSYTTTSGERVVKYDDGTKEYLPPEKKTSVPGLGTLTIKSKAVPTAAPGQPPADENLDGLYARSGVNPPASSPTATTPAGYEPPTVDGFPSYPQTYNPNTAVNSILDSYKTTLTQLNDLETRIASSAVASDEERKLQKLLNKKRSELDAFDLGTLQATESQEGQGRGRSIANVALSQGKITRVRALERLGLAQEAETLSTQLGFTKEERQNLGALATTQYNLATKKLDLALGIQNTIKGLADEERDNARQYLLDVVNFAEGKEFSKLDADTQQAITAAVANTPITLGMVKSALEKGAQADAGELRTVSGLGVVQIVPDGNGGFTYRVVVPENPGDSDNSNAPTFEQFVQDKGLSLQALVSGSTPNVTNSGTVLPSLFQNRLQELRTEYDQTYQSGNVSLGKLTATNKTDLSQAGLSNAPTAVKSYFLNTPPAFRDEYQRNYASGEAEDASLSSVISAYTKWYEEQNKSSGTRDWGAILNKTPQ